MTQYRVFFSKDCMMYGVEELRENINYTGEPARWTQVLPPKDKGARRGQSAYTYYKGVAERWLKEFTPMNDLDDYAFCQSCDRVINLDNDEWGVIGDYTYCLDDYVFQLDLIREEV